MPGALMGYECLVWPLAELYFDTRWLGVWFCSSYFVNVPTCNYSWQLCLSPGCLAWWEIQSPSWIVTLFHNNTGSYTNNSDQPAFKHVPTCCGLPTLWNYKLIIWQQVYTTWTVSSSVLRHQQQPITLNFFPSLFILFCIFQNSRLNLIWINHGPYQADRS